MIEQLAHDLYTTYCNSVGGKAFNGDPLPGASEFFLDESKRLQADAWRETAKRAREILDQIRAQIDEFNKNQ